ESNIRESAILDGLYTSLFFCNDFQKGTYYLDKKLATKPDNFNPYYLKALTLLKSNKLENVLEYLNKALLAKDILRDNIVQVNLHKLAYFLLKEDYEGFATLWKASTLESIGNNFTITKDQKEEKIEITIDFNKKTGSINSSLKIPTKVFVMLKDKYGVELNDSK
nr:hypothetical protein [Flavobacterium sp.]